MNTMVQRCLILIAGILIALSFGFSYGNVGNQATYLPHALHHIAPDFLASDWLVQETTVYHGNFRWIVLILAFLGSIGWGAALLNSFLILLSLYLIYRWHAEIHRPSAFHAFVLTILFVVFDKAQAVGDSYLFSSGLQPSVLATTAWIGAIWFFFRNQFSASGCVLALGALFHANFMVLGIGLFTLVHLFLGRKRFFSRWMAQVGPSFLVLIFALPMLLAAAGGEEAQLARKIFLEIRASHHYVPSTYPIGFWYLGGWTLCGLAAVYAMSDLPKRSSLMALIAALAVSVTGATLLTTVVFVPQISQLYVWRLAPFLQILCQCSVAILLIRQLQEPFTLGVHRTVLLLVFAVGLLGILRWVSWSVPVTVQTGAMLLLLCLYFVLWLGKYKNAGNVPGMIPAFSIIVLAVLSGVASDRTAAELNKSTLLHPERDSLIAWTQTTPPKAVFLIPLEMDDFRLLGGRAVVVDWKSTPILPKELVAWYERVNAVSGETVKGYSDAVNGYRNHNLAQLKELAKRFSATYIVVDNKNHRAKIEHEAPVFRNEHYSVYANQTVTAKAADRK